MEPINFYLGDESRLVIDDFKLKNESLFKDSYDKALNVIYDFIQESQKNDNISDKDSASVFFRQTADSVKNNVVAFLGDRGTGKTSCMLSVANMLRKINSCENDKNGEKIKNSCKKGFEILETIDPSFFDEKANVLEVVLGRLFSNFRKKVDDGYTQGFKDNECKKNELFKTFQEVKECLTHMNAEKCVCEEDTAEGLLKLTASVDMRNTIENLVQNYLDFIGRDYLVILIDDIDMHTEHAYEMAEEIRKYLKQPKIIVLMALKLEQLEDTIELHFNKIMSEKIVPKSTIIDMALKYVIKLIPENNRVYLPSVSAFADREVNVYRKSGNDKGKEYKGYHWNLVNKNRDDKEDDNNESEDHSYQTLKYYVTSLIFRKTRYLFYHFQGKISPIVPNNLRELRFLIEMLNSMDDYTKENKCEYNKEKFKNYFLTTWAENNLSTEGCNYLQRLFKINETENINKFVLKIFQEMYKDFFKIIEENEKKETNDRIKLYTNINRICSIGNRSYNISLGDVLYVQKTLKSSETNETDKMFFFAIETFYSMRLYEFYDRITEYHEPENMDKYIDEKIKKNDILDGYHDYEILIGCNFIHLFNNHIYQDIVYEVFKKNEKTGENEKKKENIGFEAHYIIYRKILKYWDEIKDLNEYHDASLTKLHFIEFFVLCLSFKNYESYRLLDTVAFDSPIDKKQKYVWFDLLSFFANIIDAEKHYNRVDEKLFKTVVDEPNSLYNKIIYFCEQINNRRFMSCVSIRNVEILDDFISYLRKKRNNFSGCPDEFSKIKKVICDIKKYEMMTYDPGEEANSRFSVNFKFFEEIENIFKEDGAKEIFDDIYNSVINEKKNSTNDAELEKMIARIIGKTGRTVRNEIKTYIEKYCNYKFNYSDKMLLNEVCPNGMKINNAREAYELVEKIMNLLFQKENDFSTKNIAPKPSVNKEAIDATANKKSPKKTPKTEGEVKKGKPSKATPAKGRAPKNATKKK